MKKLCLITLIYISILGSAGAQGHFEPNYALKSPATLELINIEIKEETTVISFSIENQIEGGYFCIDKNTFITTDEGELLKLINISGLPYCPKQYKFTRIGEEKFFTMTFPPIKQTVKWIDIEEKCSGNCLEVLGVSLDPGINSEINICFRDIDQGRNAEAIKRFEDLRIKLIETENPILGSVYLNLITLYQNKGETKKSNTLKSELGNLIIPHKEKFLEALR